MLHQQTLRHTFPGSNVRMCETHMVPRSVVLFARVSRSGCICGHYVILQLVTSCQTHATLRRSDSCTFTVEETLPHARSTTVTTRRHQRAATQGDLYSPRTRTVTYGSRAFAISGPTFWNALPSSLKSSSLKPGQFCSLLKTTLMAQPS